MGELIEGGLEGFDPADQVDDHYRNNPAFAAVLDAVPGFEYAKWSQLPLALALGRLSLDARDEAENALNGWSEKNIGMTARQAQFVDAHSGVQRSDWMRDAIAEVGSEALALMQAGDVQGARTVLGGTGLSAASIGRLLAGWQQDLGHGMDEVPAVCCVVNALGHKTYVGRVVRMDETVIWQEVEPGQIVEHERDKLGVIPAAMADPFYRQKDIREGGIKNPWHNSWVIAYENGEAVIKPASLTLLDGNSVKPNPFAGTIVSETGKRFVQDNGGTVFSGHLKAMTGELEIGNDYELAYRGPSGTQVIEVRAMEVALAEPVVVKTVVESAPGVAVDVVAVTQDVTVNGATKEHEPAVGKKTAGDWWTTRAQCGEAAVFIGASICVDLNVVVMPREIVRCINRERENESFSGRILGVDEQRGLVVQSLGRGSATVHLLADFESPPQVGLNMDIKYKGGQIVGARDRGPIQGKAVAR